MKKDLIKESFSSSAKTYDSVAKVQNLSSRELIKLIDLENVSTVIDIGCGTGNTSLELYKKFPTADYTLCDISQEMLLVASQKFPKKVQTICCDAELFLFEKNYDLAISNLSLQWFEDLPQFVNKIKNHCNEFAFSTLLDASFDNYRNCFENPPTFDYPSAESLLDKIGSVKKYRIVRYTLKFENFFAVAKYFKKLGAYLRSNTKPKKIKNENPITLDYNVFFATI